MLRFLMIVMLLLQSMLCYRLWYGHGANYPLFCNLNNKVMREIQVLAELNTKNQELQQRIHYLQKLPGNIEEQARHGLGMILPHEQYFKFIEAE